MSSRAYMEFMRDIEQIQATGDKGRGVKEASDNMLRAINDVGPSGKSSGNNRANDYNASLSPGRVERDQDQSFNNRRDTGDSNDLHLVARMESGLVSSSRLSARNKSNAGVTK